MRNMKIVGITGRSGSGKSSLARYYAFLGYPVEDGDELSRYVCGPGSVCVAQLCAVFGESIVDEAGRLQRGRLGTLAYEDPALNQKLIDITHPYILTELRRREKNAEESGEKLFFIDGAMLIGSIFEPHCDQIILVESGRKLSISRIILRDGISKFSAHKRLDAQMELDQMSKAADYVLENNGSLEVLRSQADQLLKQLLAECPAKKKWRKNVNK